MAKPKAFKTHDATKVRAFTDDKTIERWEINAATKAVNAAESDTTITIYDVIGQDFWTGEGVTLKRIDAALRSIGEKDVTVAINSPGGDMMEGVGIFNRLLAHPGKVTVKVMGYAASAASIIAMAGDEIEMGEGSFIMIHNAWVLAAGNKDELRSVADWLQPFDEAMVSVYAARADEDESAIRDMMDAETWLNAETAIAKGFADRMMDAGEQGTRALASAEPPVRQMERDLMASGKTRSEARSLIQALKNTGKPDAAKTATQDAGDATADISALTESLLGKITGVTHA